METWTAEVLQPATYPRLLQGVESEVVRGDFLALLSVLYHRTLLLQHRKSVRRSRNDNVLSESNKGKKMSRGSGSARLSARESRSVSRENPYVCRDYKCSACNDSQA
jgi:hypothetical protein